MKTSRSSLLAAAVLLSAAGCTSSTNPEPQPVIGEPAAAVVSFKFDGRPADTLHVLVTHGPTIEEARRYVNTGHGSRLPIGPIVRGAGSDARYPFHFLPDQVRLADLAIEVCDGDLMRTAAEVDAFFLGSTGSVSSPQATWCPWGAYPYAVQMLSVPRAE